MAAAAGPDIVNSGLVLALDAANPKSYPGSGATWYDLSGNGKHHTLANSPTYSANSFTLNETQGFSYNGVITTATNCTVVLYYKTTDVQELWVRGNSAGNFYLAACYEGSSYYHSNVGSPTNYVDLEVVTNPNPNGSNKRNGNYHMWEAKNCDFSSWNVWDWFLYGSSWNMNGTVATVMIYNRALTSTESAQNFNALRTRFGI
jgi:hypothetical protein